MIEFQEQSVVWRKSVRSGGGNCVEVAFSQGYVFVRDSKDPEGGWIQFSLVDWNAFLVKLRD